MKTYDVIIIGGGPAAIVTGITVKKFFKEKSVLMIKEEADGLVPCGIPYIFNLLGNDAGKNKMGPKPFVNLGGEVVVDSAIKVDKTAKKVLVKSGEEFSYGKLVFATGSEPVIPTFIPGHDLRNVFYVKKSFPYIHELASKISGFKNIVIVGGGFIGAEVAEQMAASGMNITLVESEPLCFSKAFSPELSAIATDVLRETKVNVMTSTLVKEITGENDTVQHVVLSDGRKIEADAVTLSIGYKANSQLAEESGLELNRFGDIHVDNYGRTTVKDISAVGDCAQTFGFLTGRSDVIKLASTATAEARTLGHNIFGIRIKKCTAGTLGVFSTEINGLAMAAAGANEKSAGESGVELISSKFSSPDRHPGGLPGMSNLTVKLYASPVDGSILGGEAWGGKSVGEIINIISLAIQKSITVFELISFQVGTHPLLTASPVNNPIVRAAEDIVYKMTCSKY
ncbi:SidA/IucD/PvdA family monooxygenase [Maribellus comscasis]|uniref:SidA/IucD/PvdA family monooxygenase n=1 Tax=Maribellus comscasis TaxID=2681766 RepID=A0A6I6KBM8_9BACT|nr:FAD-dependent oxidoreductase [Maribellus comscasis]QGY47644.1 SidA/IucD/PvdA family monooxygenase [Maribellus comscasis]